jgi:hypothetical protein
MQRIQCERCGFQWELHSRQKTVLCGSCRARKVQTVHTRMGKCLPWHGGFAADDVTPLDDDGMPVLPGVRLCGHNDCVNVLHIQKEGMNDDKE